MNLATGVRSGGHSQKVETRCREQKIETEWFVLEIVYSVVDKFKY